MVCSGVTIGIRGGEMGLINEHELLSSLTRKFGEMEGRKITEIEIDSIANFVERMQTVSSVGVYISQTGRLHINLRSRKPLFRVFTEDGRSFAVDAEGVIIPISKGATFRSIVVTGNVSERSVVGDILKLVTFIDRDPLWSAMFEQINVERSGEVILIPKVGDFKIRLGEPTDIEQKLANLRLFLEQGIEKVGWGAYREVNLKYKNQVVGVKI